MDQDVILVVADFLALAVRALVGAADEFRPRRGHACLSLIAVAMCSASRGRKMQTRCHSVLKAHSSSAVFQERRLATERTVNFEPLFRA